MSLYKLTYFDCRYLGENIRLLFAKAGVEYEDCRLDEDKFEELKATGKLPLGQLPILEFNGRILAQSQAIQRYLAKEFGLYGCNNLEAAEIDEITETFRDLLLDAAPFLYKEEDPVKREKIKKNYFENRGPLCLSFLEKKIQNSSSGYYVGQNVTVADLAVFNTLDILQDHVPDLISPYSKLLEFKKKVEKDEKIAKYLANRPKCVL